MKRDGSTVWLLEGVEVGQGAAEDGHDSMDLGAVAVELGIALGHGVDGFVLLQAVALEAEALGQLLDLGEEDEVDVLLAEVALALRTPDGAVVGRLDKVDHELAFALRALEDFRQHSIIL